MNLGRITRDTVQVGGVPFIHRLRISAAIVVRLIAQGTTKTTILDANPDLARDTIEAAFVASTETSI